MSNISWQPIDTIEAIVFDCDGTLSTLEGIDEIARHKGIGHQIESLTAHAMTHAGISPEFYSERLSIVRPTLEQTQALGLQYYQNRVEDISHVIETLMRLNKTVYIVSAGMYQAVAHFGNLLTIPMENIHAIHIHFDEEGQYHDFDRGSPLVNRTGKRDYIMELKKKHKTLLHVGDGLNDHVVYDLVTRFVGFGGAFFRENIAAACEYYIKSPSMAPLLPLALTQEESLLLTAKDQTIYEKGLSYLRNQHVIINPQMTGVVL